MYRRLDEKEVFKGLSLGVGGQFPTGVRRCRENPPLTDIRG